MAMKNLTTITISRFVYGHEISTLGIIAIVITFFALFFKIYMDYMRSRKNEMSQKNPSANQTTIIEGKQIALNP